MGRLKKIWGYVRTALGLAADLQAKGVPIPGVAGQIVKKGREAGLWSEKASPAEIFREELRKP